MPETELWRACANAWECDENAHLNVRFWLAKANEAFAVLAIRLGAADARPIEQHIRFLREARAGDSLYGVGGVAQRSGSQIDAWVELRFSASHAPAMTVQARLSSERWDERALEAHAAAAPGHAARRGLDDHRPMTPANRSEAERLGLVRVGLRAVTAGYCEGDGRVAADAAIGFISDSVGNLYAMRGADFDARGDEGIGGVALEYRLVHRARPKEGDVVSLWSAPTALMGKVGRYAHWLIDEATGEAWCTAEAVVGFLDLKARKLAEPTPEAAKVFEEAMAPNARC